MSFSKKIRETVYAKYNGRCAYCGKYLAIKDMQVDHFRPLKAWNENECGSNDLSNLMPACRTCNHYKRANSIETFRRYIEEIPQKLMKNYIYKVGLKYDQIYDTPHPVRFYFEGMKDISNGMAGYHVPTEKEREMEDNK